MSWPGRATSCGWSIRRSPACARGTSSTVSCRVGGRRSSRRWRRKTAATSTAWPWSTVSPKYVTALAETDTPQGWRPNKATSGCLIDVPSGATVARGFAMPHSPRAYRGRVWLLDSGTGRLVVVDPTNGRVEPVAELPGYTRGLALHGSFAFVGLSKIRETSTFGGVPIADRREELKCGVGVVALETGQQVAHLEFCSGVEEIFDVQVLPGLRFPAVSGPFPVQDGGQPIWIVPDPRPGDAMRPGARGPA